MAKYAFRILNVFAETTFGGNPVCVFEDGRSLSDEQMLLLTRQFNLSETTFVLPSERAQARVRVFTPGYEMPFAGHPTLGTAHVIRDLAQAGNAFSLEFKAGIVPVSAIGDVWTLSPPLSAAPALHPAGSDRAALAAVFGLADDDLADMPYWVNTGADQLLIPLQSEAAVNRAVPDPARLDQWPLSGIGQRSAYLFAITGTHAGVTEVSARFFFTTRGAIGEDPGTGSACANLGAWMIARRQLYPAKVKVSQGDRIERPCRLQLDIGADKSIKVGGQVIEIGRGVVDI